MGYSFVKKCVDNVHAHVLQSFLYGTEVNSTCLE